MDPCELLNSARRGDERARAELVERFYPGVRDAVHQQLARDLRQGRPWLAAQFSTGDIVQEVFLGVLRDLDGFSGEDERAFQALLTAMVRNRLLDTLRYHEARRRDGRRVQRGVDPTLLGVDSDGSSPTAVAARSEETDAVRRALAALPERDRSLIVRRFTEGMSYAEIAAAEGIVSDEAARKAVGAARARLLVQLRKMSSP